MFVMSVKEMFFLLDRPIGMAGKMGDVGSDSNKQTQLNVMIIKPMSIVLIRKVRERLSHRV